MPPRTPPPGVIAYAVVALLGAIPLLLLSAAAPGGETYRYLEVPRHPTIVAVIAGVVVATVAVHASRAALVPLATAVLACVWNVIATRGSAELVVEDTLVQLAPWLVGALYGLLALMAIRRSATPYLNRRRAGAWLVLVGVLAIVLTLANESWLVLKNLTEAGTYRSSSSWPDTKILSMVAAVVTAVIGLAVVVRAQPASK